MSERFPDDRRTSPVPLSFRPTEKRKTDDHVAERRARPWSGAWADGSAIPADAERQFAERMGAATIEVASGHLAMVTHADEAASLIDTAANALTADALATV